MLSETTKQRVLELRRRGASYGQIAAEVEVSRNTVKSICRRAAIVTDQPNEQPAVGCCDHCQTRLPMVTSGRRFCSTTCRLAWWHAHPERLNRKAIYVFTCAYCATKFSAYGNRNRKYCTHACYIRDRFGTRGGRS